MSYINYRTLGTGTPVVLLHGFCETNEIWGVYANLLAQRFQVIIADLPGFGKSELPKTPFSMDDIGTLVWKWLDDLGVKQPAIVGHSLGGYVALAMTHQRPADVSGFCLMNSTAKADTAEKKKNRDKTIDFVTKNGVAPFIETFVPGLFFDKNNPSIKDVTAIANSTPKETLIAYAAAMRDRENRRQVLEDFKGPILFAAGEKDEVIPLESLMDQAVQPKRGRLCILSDSGHMGMLESTTRCVEITTQFVGSTLEPG